MMLVLPMPPMARISAAQLVPPSTIWPRPIVRPLGRPGDRIRIQHALDDLADAGAVRSGWTKPPAGSELPLESVSADDPVDAQVDRLVGRHLDQDRLHQHLRAADVEPVDDGHDRAHHLRRRGDDQRVGLRLGPDRDALVAAAALATAGARARRRRRPAWPRRRCPGSARAAWPRSSRRRRSAGSAPGCRRPTASGVSRCVTSVFRRRRCEVSPLTSTLLVRSSAITLTCGMPAPSAAAPPPA